MQQKFIAENRRQFLVRLGCKYSSYATVVTRLGVIRRV